MRGTRSMCTLKWLLCVQIRADLCFFRHTSCYTMRDSEGDVM
uniref:Uncharacterized protein n=1 Tax=Anguilla anguilla TaxID=7936 RepID=A0A0E9THP6_ANGAN